MSWNEYVDRFASAGATTVVANGDLVTVKEHRENALGVQAEFEVRALAHVLPGVITGMAPTEDDDDDEIDIAAGVAIVAGLKAVGGVSVSLVGEASGTYYIVVDPDEATEAGAYKAVATPTPDQLVLARCDWDGTDTITNFVDLRQRGQIPWVIEFSSLADTALSAYDTKIIKTAIAPCALCIRRVYARVVTCGSADSTIIDVHTGAAGSTASVFGTAGDRPTAANDDTDGAVIEAQPDANLLVAAGELIEIHVDDVATDAAGLSVLVLASMYQ